METNENVKQDNNERRERAGIKLIIIALLCMLLLIPWFMIRSMIDERSGTEGAAEEEVCEKWGTAQVVKGPALKVYTGADSTSFNLLPEVLDVDVQARTRTLSRGIYDFTVYDADVTLRGSFVLPATLTARQRATLSRGGWKMSVDLSSLKGLTDNPVVIVDGQPLAAGRLTYEGQRLMWTPDLAGLLAGGRLDYEVRLPLRGSRRLDFAPMGTTTTVTMHSDCATPSFDGGFLPVERSVTAEGFEARWRVLAINRSFSQVLAPRDWGDIGESVFGVELRRPVEQYLQNERAVKYAYLVVLLTFAVVFFVELRRRRPIHPVQYLLIGIAVMLFYTLLLSFSEHLTFLAAYLIASVMTAGLLGCYLGAIMRDWRVGLLIGGLLALLYAFIYILLQIESYALLVGSVGLFVVLAVAMAASRKIEWYAKG